MFISILCFLTSFVISNSVYALTTVRTLPISSTANYEWYKQNMTNSGEAEIVNLTGKGGNLENNAPLPIGAVKLTTKNDNNDRANVGMNTNFEFNDNFIKDFNISYSFYKEADSHSDYDEYAAPALKLQIYDEDYVGDNYGSLIWEPYWQGKSGPVKPTTGEWSITGEIKQNTGWGKDSYGGWWTSGIYKTDNGAGGPPIRSLNEWYDMWSSEKINPKVVSIQLGIGSYNKLQNDYFDNVAMYLSDGSTTLDETYNFEPVPEPTTMLLFATGLLGLVGLGRKKYFN